MRQDLLRLVGACAAVVFAAHPAMATLVVVPASNANSPSSHNANGVFGNNSSSDFVTQIDYGAAQLSTVPVGSLISAIGFRLYSRSGTIANALNYTEFDIQIGQSANSIASLSRSFAANLGSDTELARSGPLTIAAGTFIGNKSVNPFYTINFTTPYAYTGGDLLITISDILAADTVSTYVSLDAVSSGTALGDVGGQSSTGLPTTGTANFFYVPVTQLTYSAAPVPEPASWVLMAGGLSAVVFGVRRRRDSTG